MRLWRASLGCESEHERNDPVDRLIEPVPDVHPSLLAGSIFGVPKDCSLTDLAPRIAALVGASSASRKARIQSLWSGYGEVVRYTLWGSEHRSVVVKHVRPPRGSGRGHDRKLRSYEVEQAWYSGLARRCTAASRVPACFHVERQNGEWLFLLEDLDDARRPGLDDCLRWLAAFHATFLGTKPRGLWRSGTYWNLATRPDELKAMARGPLRDGAAAIDLRLKRAGFLTLVHGDAKPANFCTTRDGVVAAVDFQYVGGGCGMKDVAYLLYGEDRRRTEASLDLYFAALGAALADRDVDVDALEAEWRALFPWACADFHRFLTGWAPDWQISRYWQGQTRDVLGEL